jgi:hypothetical protein
MLYLANASTDSIRDAMLNGPLGCIVTPASRNRLPVGTVWAADNGCGPGANGTVGAGFPGYEAYLYWLQTLADEEGADRCDPDQSGCLFAVAPDVVGDAAATMRRAETMQMLGWIRHLGLPAAFVAQNGLTIQDTPWEDLDALFLGGSAECLPCGYIRPATDHDTKRCPFCHRRLVEWKLSQAARELTAEARQRGKWVHMGRVNSAKRLRYAAGIGCDSADGTYLTNGPDKNLPKVLQWVADLRDDTQEAMWPISA